MLGEAGGKAAQRDFDIENGVEAVVEYRDSGAAPLSE
jgi:hypothetical protein